MTIYLQDKFFIPIAEWLPSDSVMLDILKFHKFQNNFYNSVVPDSEIAYLACVSALEKVTSPKPGLDMLHIESRTRIITDADFCYTDDISNYRNIIALSINNSVRKVLEYLHVLRRLKCLTVIYYTKPNLDTFSHLSTFLSSDNDLEILLLQVPDLPPDICRNIIRSICQCVHQNKLKIIYLIIKIESSTVMDVLALLESVAKSTLIVWNFIPNVTNCQADELQALTMAMARIYRENFNLVETTLIVDKIWSPHITQTYLSALAAAKGLHIFHFLDFHQNSQQADIHELATCLQNHPELKHLILHTNRGLCLPQICQAASTNRGLRGLRIVTKSPLYNTTYPPLQINLNFKHLEYIGLIIHSHVYTDVINILSKTGGLKALYLDWHWPAGNDNDIRNIKQALHQCVVDNPNLTCYGNHFHGGSDVLSCLFPISQSVLEYLDVEIHSQLQKNQYNHWLRKASLSMRAAKVAKNNIADIASQKDSLPENVYRQLCHNYESKNS